MLAPPTVGALEGEDVVPGEGGGDPREGRAGVLVDLEVLAAGVLRDLLQPDLERVPAASVTSRQKTAARARSRAARAAS